MRTQGLCFCGSTMAVHPRCRWERGRAKVVSTLAVLGMLLASMACCSASAGNRVPLMAIGRTDWGVSRTGSGPACCRRTAQEGPGGNGASRCLVPGS